MPEPSHVVIDRIDWKSVLPVLRLASAFKYALQPGKLIVALIAVLAIHLSGAVLGSLFTNSDAAELGSSEVERYLVKSTVADESNPYEDVVRMQARAFSDLKRSAMSFDHGFGPGEPGVIDALGSMFMGIPADMFDQHPWFTLLFGADVLLVLLLTSGVICRMAAPQITRNQSLSLNQAIGFVAKRWNWYLLSPLMPLLVILFIGGLLALAGLVFFNVPWIDVVGSLLYGLLLLGGFVVALVMVLTIFSLCLMPSALSVEGTDGFDTVARCFNYVLFKPWQFAGYTLAAIVYLAVVSVLVSSVAGLSVSATYSFVDLGAVSSLSATPPSDDASIADSVIRHDMIVSGVDAAEASGSSSVLTSAWIVTRWFGLLTAIAVAILFSTFCCLQTQVYVLLRRSADGTPMDQCEGGEQADLWANSSTDPSTESTEEPSTEQANDADAADAAKGEG